MRRRRRRRRRTTRSGCTPACASTGRVGGGGVGREGRRGKPTQVLGLGITEGGSPGISRDDSPGINGDEFGGQDAKSQEVVVRLLDTHGLGEVPSPPPLPSQELSGHGLPLSEQGSKRAVDDGRGGVAGRMGTGGEELGGALSKVGNLHLCGMSEGRIGDLAQVDGA